MPLCLAVTDDDKEYRLYKIKESNHPPYMLYNEEEEGMSFTEKKLFDMFDNYFKESF